MKVKIDRKTFAQALAEVSPFANSKGVIPILKNAKITTKGDRMKIEANDTQCCMVKYIRTAECDQDGSFLVNIAELSKFIAKTKGDMVEAEVNGNTLFVRHSKGTAEFQSEDVNEFPVFKMPDTEATEIEIGTAKLIDTIQKGRNFIGSDILRPQMTAIYAYIENGEFGYCATDTSKLIHGHSAYQAGVNVPDGSDGTVHWYIMPPAFTPIVNACKDATTAKISVTPTHVVYTIGDVRIQTVQVKGNYPPFKRVIPTVWNVECAVDKADVIDALGRLQIFCDASECVKMDITQMDMTLNVDNIEHMKSSKENIAHNGCDGNMTIGVNASKFLTCFTPFKSNEVLMRMTDASRPILMTAKDEENIQVILMPLALMNN